ncbi:MAG TPA: hypothetical protein VHX15_11025 [Frankiaceae bacterium]|nr:hypothetical protein [Frankiaceae bacterium]
MRHITTGTPDVDWIIEVLLDLPTVASVVRVDWTEGGSHFEVAVARQVGPKSRQYAFGLIPAGYELAETVIDHRGAHLGVDYDMYYYEAA